MYFNKMTHLKSEEKARFCLWHLYQWAEQFTTTEVIDAKKGSSWTLPSSIRNNDWFVIRWKNPENKKLCFDVLFQATDSANLNVEPFNQRGLFVCLSYHSSNKSWSVIKNQGTSPFTNGSIILPKLGHLARVFLLDNTGDVTSQISADENGLFYSVTQNDSKTNHLYLGKYTPVSETILPLMLLCWNSPISMLPGKCFPENQSGIIWKDESVKTISTPLVYEDCNEVFVGVNLNKKSNSLMGKFKLIKES